MSRRTRRTRRTRQLKNKKRQKNLLWVKSGRLYGWQVTNQIDHEYVVYKDINGCERLIDEVSSQLTSIPKNLTPIFKVLSYVENHPQNKTSKNVQLNESGYMFPLRLDK